MMELAMNTMTADSRMGSHRTERETIASPPMRMSTGSVVAEATSLLRGRSMGGRTKTKRVPSALLHLPERNGRCRLNCPDVGLRRPGRLQQINHVELSAGALERGNRREVRILLRVRMPVSDHQADEHFGYDASAHWTEMNRRIIVHELLLGLRQNVEPQRRFVREFR